MKHIYLLFASIGIALSIFGLSKMDFNDTDSTTYSKKKIVESKKRVNPPKKYRPLVLKPEEGEQKITTESFSGAFLVPSITATKSVTVNGGGIAVPGSQLNYQVLISNTGTDATGVSFNDILVNDLTLVAGSVKATPIAANDAFTSLGNVGITVPAANGLLANDVSPDNTTITATAVTDAATTDGGKITIQANGAIDYTPKTGTTATSDTYTYTLNSSNGTSSTATVTITLSGMLWFVNKAAASNGDGSFASPFQDWSNFSTANTGGAGKPDNNHTVFIYSNASDYAGAVTLRTGQKVLGQGATTTLISFAGLTLPTYSKTLPTTSGTKPNLTSAGTTITLGANNTLRGFDMGNSVKDIVGSSFITSTASEMALNGDGQALDLTSGFITYTFTSISSNNSADKGISFLSINGTLTSTGGTTITNPAAQGIVMFLNSSVNANYGNTSVTGSGGTGVQLSSLGTPTTTFGSLTITPDTGQQALVSNSNGGTITCTSGNITNRINLQGASASLKLNLNIELTSYTSDGNLQLTNTTGSFRINGTGTSGSGGSMSGLTTAPSILLNNVSNVSINYFNITNAGKSCFSATNLSGTCAINNCTFSMGTGSSSAVGNDRRCVNVINKDVALTLNVNNSTFNGNLTTSPDNNHGIAYESTTDASSSTIGTINIKTSTFNKFNNYALYVTSTGAAVTDVGFQTSNTDYDPASGAFVGSAIHLWNLRSAKLKFNILNNTSLRTAGGLPIDIYTNNFDAGTDFALPSGKSLEGKMTGNTMTGGFGMQVLVKGKAQGVVQISNNILSNGMLTLQAVENTINATNETARLDATVTDNIISEKIDSYGIDVLSGASSDLNFSNVITCVKISGNNITPRDAGGLGIIRFSTNGNADGDGFNVIWLERTNGTESGLADYWNKNNINSPLPVGTDVQSQSPNRVRNGGLGGTGNKIFKVAGTCLTPTNTAPARIAIEDYVKNDFSQADSVPTLAADKITKETSIEKSDDIKIKETKKSDNLTLIAYDNSVAAPTSGETITVNGSGSGFLLPAGKSTTIHFNATISSTPSTCAITNTASVSGSNFATINSNTTTTNVVVSAPTAVTPSSATSICTGTPINLSATCASGTVNWYALAVPTTLLGNSASGANFSQSPTVNTTYQAACLVGGCESTRVNSALITVNQNNTISLTSAVGTNAQTKCINTPITNITYATTGATGAIFSGLPAGVTGTWASNVVTISGSPTTTTGSPFNYTVTLTGGCGTITATGTITVSLVNTVSLTSAAGTNAQTLCTNTPITNITYATTGATGAAFSGLPAGVTGAWAGNVVTISGSPTTATGSPFNYTVTLTGGCGTVTATGTITVSPTNTISLTSAVGTNAQAKCINTAITNITYATTGATGATFSGLPTGVTGAWAGNVVTISGTPTTATGSPFNYTVTLTGGCGTTTANGTITVNSTPAPTSPTATPSNFTVAGITTLTATGCNSPSTLTWYDSANSSVALPNNTPTISANKTFFARCTGTNTCISDPSTNVSVTYNPCTPLGSSPGNVNITWTGLLSTDWNNACNWNPAWVPDATNSKIVITNTTNKPVISNAIPDIKSIEIQTSANLTINSGNTLNIRGDGGVTKGFIIAGGTVINNGTINIESATNTAIPAYIYLQATSPVLTNNGTIKINSTDEAIGVGIVSSPATITNSLNGVINIVNGIGVEIALPTDAVNFNNAGTINYDGSVLAFKFLGTTNFINTGTVNINSGTGIENPVGNTIANNACGKILMTAGTYTNAGTTTNAGLMQMPNAYGFVNTGTFTNNGVVKANAVSGITNNKMVITNACPIFTLGGSNNYTVNGIFTDAGATTSAGTYTSVGNKFTANNTIPTGTQTLYAKVTDGTCTFTIPFDFNNVKPTSVSISTTNICVGSNVTLSATCASGTVTWYGSAAGTSPLGTGGTFNYVPSAGTGQAFYAACETTNCNSGRTITSNFVNVNTVPNAPNVTLTSPATVCQPSTLNLTATGCAGTITWSDTSTGTSLTISAAGTYNVTATCTVNGCTSVTSTEINGLVIKSKPNAPTITPPASLSVCSPSTLTLTASGCAGGTVVWSQGAASGTSLTISAVGTYAVSATCTINGCTSDASTSVTGLEIKAKPNAPTITPPTTLVVCSPATLTLTASACAGTVTWSQGAATGTSLTLSTVGTYSISATCTVNGCTSDASTPVNGLEIKAKPNAPTITPPVSLSVCSPSTLTLTASGCTGGTVVWSQGAASGTSLTISAIGTYSVSATCTANGCTSDVSTPVNGLEIKAKPNAPTITPPTTLVVCSPSTLTLTAGGCAGTITWSQGAATGTSLILSTAGTYSISATCTVNGCTSDASTPVNGLEIKAKPNAPTITPPASLSVCSPSTLTLTASGCTGGTVVWSQGAASGTSLTISTVGTYSISATCTVNGCTSDASSTVTGLEIKAKPNAPSITPPTTLVVCSPSTLTLTAGGCAGTITWSQGAATGTSLTLSTVGTYSVSATCTVNGCTSDASTPVNGLEIKAKPNAPIITPPASLAVCSPSTLTLTASGCAGGTVVWSQGAASGTSLTISAIGTYSISATCTANGCTSDVSTPVNGLEIKAKPNAPTITPPTTLVVCSPSTLTLTASGCAGTITWSQGAASGTSLTISTVGTYSVSATCTVNGCTSDASTPVNGLEIKAKPNAPTITPPASISICSPSTLTLTASGCAGGTVVWSQGAASGTSLTISVIGTYSVSATCTANGCTSDVSTPVNGLEIKAKPNAPTITPPTTLVVCSPSTLTLTAGGCAGTITWSQGAVTGTSLTLSTVGTYSISATCTVNGCTSDASATITGLEIKAKPIAPTVTPPTSLSVCSPSTLTLTASGCAGMVTWSQGAATGTSLTLSTVGTYSISATCTVNGCTSDASSTITGLEIKAKPNAPTITPPTSLSVCSPSTLTLTASGCAGMVTWSQGAATGTSLTLSTVGTYSISATCTVNGCTSDASTPVSGLEIKAKPNAPTITPPTSISVCSPSTLTLIASGCAGMVTWSQGAATGTSLTLSTVGTYSISATCTVNGCTSDASTPVSGLEIKATPIITATNTGPYTVGQTISLIGTGAVSYNWTGPNNFSSTLSNPTVSNALSVNGGVYTLSVTGVNGCNAVATTNVIVSGIDPCDPSRIVDYSYVKAGNPYQTLFPLTNGMIINQRTDQVSILVNPVCPSVTIESFEMNLQGPEMNWNILQNVSPYALFDNVGNDVWGRNLKPGVYTLTVTGYPQDNKGGVANYGPKVITFTIVGDLATINAPTLSKTAICAGSNVDVSFTTTGSFNGINQFQVELSDSSGSFAAPVLIGTTNTIGTLNCTIPQSTFEGSKYLIRVTSTNQVVVSNPAMSLVTVHPFSYNLVSPTNNLTGTNTKKAVSTINASNKVTSPASVTYQAGNSILLTPGFESGAVFKAEIQGCNN